MLVKMEMPVKLGQLSCLRFLIVLLLLFQSPQVLFCSWKTDWNERCYLSVLCQLTLEAPAGDGRVRRQSDGALSLFLSAWIQHLGKHYALSWPWIWSRLISPLLSLALIFPSPASIKVRNSATACCWGSQNPLIPFVRNYFIQVSLGESQEIVFDSDHLSGISH